MSEDLVQQANEAAARLLQPYCDPQVIVLALSPDRQSIQDVDLRPLSELTAILAAQSHTRSSD